MPVKEKALQAAISEAKQEAESTTINTLTAQMMAQQTHDQKGSTVISQRSEFALLAHSYTCKKYPLTVGRVLNA